MILPKDRDLRFITVRRGGTLMDSDHRLLALWAAVHFWWSARTIRRDLLDASAGGAMVVEPAT